MEPRSIQIMGECVRRLRDSVPYGGFRRAAHRGSPAYSDAVSLRRSPRVVSLPKLQSPKCEAVSTSGAVSLPPMPRAALQESACRQRRSAASYSAAHSPKARCIGKPGFTISSQARKDALANLLPDAGEGRALRAARHCKYGRGAWTTMSERLRSLFGIIPNSSAPRCGNRYASRTFVNAAVISTTAGPFKRHLAPVDTAENRSVTPKSRAGPRARGEHCRKSLRNRENRHCQAHRPGSWPRERKKSNRIT